ncbi:MAG: hypothetical protein CMM54_12910 [Rhodospirillaceae bacterium]|nr:hypothetical protein [Rhodospirillaceae bacterium]
MASRRRRRNRSASKQPSQPNSSSASSSKPSKKDRANKENKDSGRSRRGGLGRGFWLYMAAMMAVLMPLNFICMNQANPPAPGESTNLQTSTVLASINEPHEPYATDPPTSGPHVNETAAPGFRTGTLPDEIQVANLEIGFVIVHFNPAIAALTDEMRRLAAEFEGHELIVQPDRDLPENTPVVMTACGRIERLESYDKGRAYSFIRNYANLDQCPSSTASPTQ